jgi:HEAT repeat protein
MFAVPMLLLALAPAFDKEFDQALAAFEGVQLARPLDEKVAALERLVDLGNLGATAPIVAEYGRAAVALDEKRHAADQLGYDIERKRIVIGTLEGLAEREDVDDVLADQRESLAELEQDLTALDQAIRELSPWRDALAGGLGILFELVGESKRKRAEDVVWTDAEEHPDPAIQLASVELLGTVGGPGTALRLQKLMAGWSKALDDDQELLAAEMERIRKVEKLIQDEQVARGGQLHPNTQAEYNRVKREAGRIQRRMRETERLIDSAARAGAEALAREEGKQLDKSVASLVRAMKKARGRARLDVLVMLARTDSPAVRERTRQLLTEEKDPLARAELIDGLADMGDLGLVPLLLDPYLQDESWLVRSRSARALAHLRVKEAIPVLIERMGTEEGRVRTDIEAALESLTAQRFHGRVERWQAWWADHGEDFEVPEPPAQEDLVEAAREARGVSTVSFFGVSTDSTRVLFVLDVSGSMEFSMVPKQNPTDDPALPFDRPGKDEISRLTAAKRDLIKALGGLPDGALFNVVLYASDVWTWADELVEMSADARREVSEYVEQVGAVGGTNIYGALERALDLAGAGGRDGGKWSEPLIDTIYLLTDGRATVGLTVDTDDILAFVRERNREAGITIHTIGLSGAHDANLLRRLAEENGGRYVGR